jgi:hypothetical protein
METIAASYDFRTLCGVTLAAWKFHCPDPTTIQEIEKLISRCLAMNDTRVRIAHGTWYSNRSGLEALYMSRQSLQSRCHFRDPREIKDAVWSSMRLAGDVTFFPGGSLRALEYPESPAWTRHNDFPEDMPDT